MPQQIEFLRRQRCVDESHAPIQMRPDFALEICLVIFEGVNLSSNNQGQACAMRGGDRQMRRFLFADPSQPEKVVVLSSRERKLVDCDPVLDYTEQVRQIVE